MRHLFQIADAALWSVANRYPELTAALFGWVVLSPVARWLVRAFN